MLPDQTRVTPERPWLEMSGRGPRCGDTKGGGGHEPTTERCPTFPGPDLARGAASPPPFFSVLSLMGKDTFSSTEPETAGKLMSGTFGSHFRHKRR